MQNAGKTVTLYNYYLDPATGYDTCSRTLLSGVSVFTQTQVSIDKDGLAAADVYTMRIPKESFTGQYVYPTEYAALESKSGYFTLAKGDKIVLGIADEEKPTAAQLEAKYGTDRVMTVTGVTDNRDKRAPHIKVVGE